MGLFGFGKKTKSQKVKASAAEADQQPENRPAITYDLTNSDRSEGEYDRSKPNINVGTIGHQGHGKTTLTAAVANFCGNLNVSCDSLDSSSEEQEQDMSVHTSLCEYETERYHYTHIDCPGKTDYTPNTIVGEAMMDIAILVVSSDYGPLEQTREHIIFARSKGISKIVIFLNLTTPVDQDEIELYGMEIAEILAEYGFDEDSPMIVGSALDALMDRPGSVSSIKKLMDTIDSCSDDIVRDPDSPFFMRIQRARLASGGGAAVTGVIKRGRISIGDEVEITALRPSRRAVISEITIFGKHTESASAGDVAVIHFDDLSPDEIQRGQIIAEPGTAVPSAGFSCTAEFYPEYLTGGPKTTVRTGFSPMFFFGTAGITGTIILNEGMEEAASEGNVNMTVRLSKPLVIENGENFVIRNGQYTIASGKILLIGR